MRLRSIAAAFAFALVVAAALVRTGPEHDASAHSGAVVAKASLCTPPGPDQTAADGGIAYHYSPTYVPVDADRHFTFSWVDGDQDPTGKFTFYYLDHNLPSAVPARAVDGWDEMTGMPTGQGPLGTVMRTVDGREAHDVFVSCACVSEDAAASLCDAGSSPNCADGGARWCDNVLDWDTSQVPDGAYWIVAVNNDPPYHVFNVSDAPVRVRHGSHAPPVVQVWRPDGLGGAADQSYRVMAIVAGSGTLTMDVAYGINLPTEWARPVHVVAHDVPITPDTDGSVWWDWDTSQLPNNPYFVEITIKDDTGAKSFSDSRYSLAVFHRPDLAVPADGGAPDDLAAAANDLARADLSEAPASSGCTISGTRRSGGTGSALVGALAAFAILAARRGSRSACTG